MTNRELLCVLSALRWFIARFRFTVAIGTLRAVVLLQLKRRSTLKVKNASKRF